MRKSDLFKNKDFLENFSGAFTAHAPENVKAVINLGSTKIEPFEYKEEESSKLEETFKELYVSIDEFCID